MIALASEGAARALDGARSGSSDSIPFFDLALQHDALGADLSRAMHEVVLSGRCILGPAVESFEEELSRWLGGGHAVAVGSGTDALGIALRALGLRDGAEVVTSPFTFVATASSIVHAGARPVFADIDPDTWCLAPESVERVLSPRVAAVLPVHLFGRMADMRWFDDLRARRGLAIVEDAAQAFGSSLEGRSAGVWGDAGCFSFYPTKNLGAAGDAGAIVLRDPDLARRARRLRAHGDAGRFEHVELGGTHRMDSLQAAILRVKLPRVREWIARRRSIVELYRQELSGTGYELPAAPRPGESVAWNLFCVRHPRRDALREHLRRRGVGCDVYYPVPLHRQPCFAGLGHAAGDFPVAEALAASVLALPLYPELDDARVLRVAEALREFDSGTGRRTR